MSLMVDSESFDMLRLKKYLNVCEFSRSEILVLESGASKPRSELND